MSMSDELDLEFKLKKLIDTGSDDEKFTFAVNNVLALCSAFNICAHCVATEVLNQMEQEEGETWH